MIVYARNRSWIDQYSKLCNFFARKLNKILYKTLVPNKKTLPDPKLYKLSRVTITYSHFAFAFLKDPLFEDEDPFLENEDPFFENEDSFFE